MISGMVKFVKIYFILCNFQIYMTIAVSFCNSFMCNHIQNQTVKYPINTQKVKV